MLYQLLWDPLVESFLSQPTPHAIAKSHWNNSKEHLKKRKWGEKENGKKIWNLISIEILELYTFTLTFSLYAILLPGPILFSLSIQYEGIPRSSAISCRCEVLLEFHPPITNIRSKFSSTSLYIASWRSWQWNKLLN